MFPPQSAVPLKPIPGSYGLPFFGAIKDRLDYFYNQGKDEFFSSRVEKYQSTVFKTNMPPGPFIAQNPKVIAVLDAISFPILFDTSKIEKFNVLDGTYLPSLSFTGGYRVCAYLDPSEPNHTSLKSFFMSVLASKHKDFVPLFRTCLSQMFIDIEDEMGSKRTANFNDSSDAMSFNFVFRLFCEKDPSETKLGSEGPAIVDKWVGLQLAPLATIGFPKFLKHFEDLLMHTFPIPFFLVKSDYKKLYDAFYASSSSVLDKAESFGIDRDEACHNLVFVAGEKLHRQLANEIRTVVKEEGGVTFQALEKMTLTKSVVFEALRIEPGVPFQYGKAKEDIVINSHDAAYEIKKGEMIFGYQPFATKDPKIFIILRRENLLKYVYWSNGRETEDPTVGNKQCPGKDLVVLLSRLLVVELFLRYDTFTVETAVLPFGSSVTLTSLIKATST
ncbi:hypothetical protein POPTR_004G148600v4 [Populus trichocarpa]|uniref:Uncharacterized protein n=1 Tax=Populus trichocarpa TaxID=3694 RepID=A0ACC0T4V8_POPTR|nr:hypothetical protein POPTR_004G148600v4 [Populus trichocarpa]